MIWIWILIENTTPIFWLVAKLKELEKIIRPRNFSLDYKPSDQGPKTVALFGPTQCVCCSRVVKSATCGVIKFSLLFGNSLRF